MTVESELLLCRAEDVVGVLAGAMLPTLTVGAAAVQAAEVQLKMYWPMGMEMHSDEKTDVDHSCHQKKKVPVLFHCLHQNQWSYQA